MRPLRSRGLDIVPIVRGDAGQSAAHYLQRVRAHGGERNARAGRGALPRM